jgi:hypothetical protein
MDLGRWRIRHLGHAVGKALGNVLDGEMKLPASGPDDDRQAFEINNRIDTLDRDLASLRPGATPEKVLVTFAPFFEGGLCLRLAPAGIESRLISLFLFGQVFTPPDSDGADLNLGLSSLETNQVFKISIDPILKALKLGSFSRLEGASAFAFKPSEDVVFVLFDHRPHPWQVFAIENAFLSARDTCLRLSRAKPSLTRAARGFFK